MTEQLALIALPPAQPRLTDRQAFALQIVQQHPDGVFADEVGAALHERRGRHTRAERCEWCTREANGILRNLKGHGLIIYRRKLGWFATDAPAPASERPRGMLRDDQEIPF